MISYLIIKMKTLYKSAMTKIHTLFRYLCDGDKGDQTVSRLNLDVKVVKTMHNTN